MDLHAAVGPVLAAPARGDPRGLPGRRPRRPRGRLHRPARELADAAAVQRDRPPGAGAHARRSGKVLLAHLHRAELERGAGRGVAARPDDAAARSPTRPCSAPSWPRIRARGWSEAVEEREIGVASIAAPIRDASRPGGRRDQHRRPRPPGWAPQQRRRLAEVVVEAGEAASRRLGWSPETRHLTRGLSRPMPHHRRARQGAGALRRPPRPGARSRRSPTTTRRSGMADGYAVQKELVELILADGDRDRRLQGRAHLQADAEDDRRRLPRLRPRSSRSTVYRDGDTVSMSSR